MCDSLKFDKLICVFTYFFWWKFYIYNYVYESALEITKIFCKGWDSKYFKQNTVSVPATKLYSPSIKTAIDNT